MPIDTNKGIIAWFARNHVAANLLMVCLILSGIASAYTINKEIFPAIEFDLISIRSNYPGAAPEEIEEGISIKIEEAIEDLEGIKKITSVSQEGRASLTVEVDDSYDMQELLSEIKTRVDSILSFPEQMEAPVIYQVKPRRGILWVNLYGEMDERTLKEMTKQVREELLALPSITHVDIYGERDYEMTIEVSEQQLQEYGITFDRLVAAIKNSSLDIPGGAIKTTSGDILLRTKGQAYTGEEFENIAISTRSDGTQLLLKNFAKVIDGFEERVTYSRFNGEKSLSLRVFSVGDQNALDVSRDVHAYLDTKKQQLPAGLQIDAWGDSTYYLQGRLNLMLKNMAFGALLVFLVLALFLRLRLAFWVIIGIPISFFGALFLMQTPAFDLSINMITLFGFILVLGIVVDDAIIIGESAYTEIEKLGHSADNIIRGVKKVAMPATFGVLTTIAAFMPMTTVPGPSAPIWQGIGWVVILCLCFSLVESKLILPAHLIRMHYKPIDLKRAGYLARLQNSTDSWLKRFVETRYRPFLQACVKQRYLTIACFSALLILTFAVLASGLVRWVFFPNLPSDFLRANLEMVEGASVDLTNRNLADIEAAVFELNNDINTQYGEKIVKHVLAFSRSSSSGSVVVELYKDEDREIDGFEIAKQWREKIGHLPAIKYLDINASIGDEGASDLAFRLSGKKLNELSQAAVELKQKLASYDGVFDIDDSFSGGKPEISLSLKPGAESLGISLADVARQVRQGFYGAEVQRMQRDGEEIRVMLRYPHEERTSIGDLEDMRVRTVAGNEVPFTSIADLTISDGYGKITRVDGQRSIRVQAKVDKKSTEPSEVVADIRKQFIPDLMARYPGLSQGLEGASKDERDALVGLLKAGVFALFVIYALMAIPLRSYLQPIIIMSVIPFGFIGAITGHLILGLSVSVLSLCGIVALAGVVVNDSLIMVDFVNKAREEGKRIKEAAIDAGAARFRAIVLTSMTTFLGLLPIVLEQSLQAKIVVPMAVSLAFGIVFATVITLLLVPCLYLVIDDIKRAVSKLLKRYMDWAYKYRSADV